MRSRLRRCFILLAVGLMVVAGNADAQVERAGIELPETVDGGGRTLHLASCGVRDTLWVSHYVAALYVAEPEAASEIATDPDRPKLIRLHILNDEWLPEDIPEEYRDPLRQELAQDPYSRLKAHYEALSAGDVVHVSYQPERGVSMSVNGRQIMTEPGHDLIDAMLESWSEEDPISERVQRLLLEHPC